MSIGQATSEVVIDVYQVIVMKMKAEIIITVTVIQINIRMHKHHPNLSPRNCIISCVQRESRVKKQNEVTFLLHPPRVSSALRNKPNYAGYDD